MSSSVLLYTVLFIFVSEDLFLASHHAALIEQSLQQFCVHVLLVLSATAVTVALLVTCVVKKNVRLLQL